MKCIILAAGYATRLYPLTENFPKPLLKVGGKCIVDWLIDDCFSAADEFIVVTNHKFAGHFRRWASGWVDDEAAGRADSRDSSLAGRSAGIRVIDDGTETNETRLGAVRDIQLAVECGVDYLVMAGDNVLDFSLMPFISYARSVGTSCVMAHEETRLEALQRTAVITIDASGLITSYEEKPAAPRGHLAVPPFYYYRARDISRIPDALDDGISPDAPGSFAAWLSRKVPMHAWRMTGSRHDIGDMRSYEAVRDSYLGPRQLCKWR